MSKTILMVCFLTIYLSQTASAVHPLDPLSQREITQAVQLLQSARLLDRDSRFFALHLDEPDKSTVLGFKPNDRVARRAFGVVYARSRGKTYETVVDLTNRKVLQWKEIAGVQPGLFGDDFTIASRLIRADRRWQTAVRSRGITNPEDVQIDIWGAGSVSESATDNRIWSAICYAKGKNRNPHARPLGIVVHVDLDAQRVLSVVDSGVRTVPAANNYDRNSIGLPRAKPKPFRIQQPDGPSFTIVGNEVRWQKWRFRFSVHPREGLVLHQVAYEDGRRVRSVLYRASVSEMAVPYGDPSDGWHFRCAFDEGEYGLGYYTAPHETGVDAPENAALRDVTICDNFGNPMTIRNGIALYERTDGILWKHHAWQEFPKSINESRTARQLVLSYITTIGNYDYSLRWIFHQDGVLEQQTLMTGIVLAKAVAAKTADGHDPKFGTLLAPNIEGVNHQHFFNFRLDLDIDGAADNTVVELNNEAVALEGTQRFKTAFTMTQTPLRRELEARRNMSMKSARRWKVTSNRQKNKLGQPTGYVLMPGANALPFSTPESSVRKRAGFLDAHLWVTPYDRNEMYAAGKYVNQNEKSSGLVRWTAANRSIENKDVVLWYTMGVTHIPRPEEWPVMPVHKMGFKLVPWGFFDRNPALDVPK